MIKICKKCGLEFPATLEYFNRIKRWDDTNLRNTCKKCLKKYRQENAERIKEDQKLRYLKNKDKSREYSIKYRENNKKKLRELKHKYYKENKNEINMRRKDNRPLRSHSTRISDAGNARLRLVPLNS